MPETVDFDLEYAPVSLTLHRTLWLPGDGEQSYEACRMRVEVQNAVNIQPQLFVWQRYTASVGDVVESKDRFLCVAKIADFSVYPIDNPAVATEQDGGTVPPFFRLSYLDMPFSSPIDLTSTWDLLLLHVSTLMELRVKLGYVTP